MRIVQIVERLDLGGLERLVLNLALEQKRRGDDPHIYCVFGRGSLAGEGIAAGVPVKSFSKSPGPSPRTLFRIVRALIADRPHVVHTHNPGIHHYGAVAAALTQVPVVVNTRHSVMSSQGVLYRERHFRWAMRWTDAVVSVSNNVRLGLLNSVSNLRVPCPVIPCGIPIHLYTTSRASPTPSFCVRFGTLGRMVPAKGHDILLRAFSRLLDFLPSAELRIAGGGQLHSVLRQQAVRLGIAHRVSIEEAADSAAFLQSIDVFVLSSRSEGLPLVLLEAMASRVPVVATRVGGIPEVLSEDVGWLCPAEDHVALADSMIAAAKSPDVLARVTRGAALVTERYAISAVAERYHALFEILLAQKRIRSRAPFASDHVVAPHDEKSRATAIGSALGPAETDSHIISGDHTCG